MAKLADAPDLGSGGLEGPWGFDSLHPHLPWRLNWMGGRLLTDRLRVRIPPGALLHP